MSIPRPIALEGTNPVITLADGASGALIPLPTEAIARTFQQGDDLIIVLADGNRITIADFFALEDPSLILRDPATGDYTELSLGEDGNIIGQQPRSLSELAEMFNASAAELSELQTAQAAEATASCTAWAISAAAAAVSVGVLGAIGTAINGSDDDGSTDTTDTDQGSGDGTAPTDQGTDGDGTDGTDAMTPASARETVDGQPVDRPKNLVEIGTFLENTLSGGDGNDTLDGLAGNDVLNGAGGDDVLVGSFGNDTLTGGAGNDLFHFGSGAGSDRITDFGTGSDRLEFTDGLFADLEAVRAAATETNGNLEIRLSATETLTLEGVSRDALTADTVTTLAPEPEPEPEPEPDTEPTPAGRVSITGDGDISRGGVVLAARTKGLGDEVQYQWQRSTDSGSFENIENATRWFYTLGDDDAGRIVRVQVSYTDTNGAAETVTLIASRPTDVARTEVAELEAVAPDALSLIGTPADDTLTGGPGDDTFLGGILGAGADRLEGGPGTDSVRYFAPGDTTAVTVNLETGRGEGGAAQGDTLISIENVTGGAGNDRLIGNAENNELSGFLGDDTLQGGAGDDWVDDGPGNDSLEAGEGDDTLANAEGNDTLRGGPGDDLLYAGGSRAVLNGVSDNDVLDGGTGNDTVTYEGLGASERQLAGVEASLVTGQATVTGFDTVDDPDREEPLTSTDTLINIENLVGGHDDDTLTGDDAANRLDGAFGDDAISGGNGNDHITGGAGNDTLTGGEGDDVFRFNAVEGREAEALIGFSAFDSNADMSRIVEFGPGSDRITDFGTGSDRLLFEGGLFADLEAVRTAASEAEGNLQITLSRTEEETETLTLAGVSLADLTADTVTTLDVNGNDTTTPPPEITDEGGVSTGTEGRDVLLGSSVGDVLDGGAGDDVLLGRAGNDTLTGGAGNDIFRFGPGAGSDIITDFDVSSDRLEFIDGLFANLGAVQASTHETESGDITILLLGTQTLTLEGLSLDDLLPERTTTLSEDGSDTTSSIPSFYFFFDADGTPTGAQNAGTAEANDLVETGVGNDLLLGLGGDDTLDGGAGSDTLTGGIGDDLFRFAPGAGSDRITDFDPSSDRLLFEGSLFANLAAVQAAATETNGNLHIQLSETDTLTLVGASPTDLTADTVTTLNEDGDDTTTPQAVQDLPVSISMSDNHEFTRASDAASSTHAPQEPAAQELPLSTPMPDTHAEFTGVSDAPAGTGHMPDALSIDAQTLMRLAATEGVTLPPSRGEPPALQPAGEAMFSPDKALALADPAAGPTHIPAFDPDMDMTV